MSLRSITLSVIALAIVAGCAEEPISGESNGVLPNEQVATASSELSSDFYDWSGRVMVRVKACGWKSGSGAMKAPCALDDTSFVLIGGGAEVEGLNNPGALLTGSYPNPELTTWTASAKDHKYATTYRVRAFSVGLKLIGNDGNPIAPDTLRSYMQYAEFPEGSSQHPTATAEIRSDYRLLGGGAKTNMSLHLLVGSYPDGIQWVAESKDHGYAQSGSVTAYAIGITSGYIPNFGQLSTYTRPTSSWVNTSYDQVRYPLDSGWAPASVGGLAVIPAGHAGRLLTQLVPYYDVSYSWPGGAVTTKDHIYVDSGDTEVWVTGIQKKQ